MYFSRNFHATDYSSLLVKLREKDLDGYVVCWGTFGIQLANALQYLGKQIPQDAKIIALDSLPFLEYFDPPLTSMSLPFYEMAYVGTKSLLEIIGDPNREAVQKSFSSQLEMRSSV